MSFVGYIPDRTEERRKEKMYFDRVWESWTPEEKAEWLKRQKESEKFAEMFMGVFFLVTGIAYVAFCIWLFFFNYKLV